MVIVFVLWNVSSLFWTIAVDETRTQVITYLQLIIFIWIIWDLYHTYTAVNTALQVYILGSYIAIVSTIYDYIIGREISLYSGGRYAGVGNAVELALILTFGLPIAWHLITSPSNQNKNRILRIVNVIYIPAALFAILLSGTRMAIFAVIPAIAFIFGTSYRLKPSYRLMIFVVLIFSLVLVQPYIPRSVIERLGTTGVSIATGDLGGRVTLWLQSLTYFYDHPMVGIGSGALTSNYVLGAMAHNTFLSVLTELGIIGFLLFMCILIITLAQALRQKKTYALLWVTILAIWSIGVFTLTWEYRKATWLFLTMIVVSAHLNSSAADQENNIPIVINT